MTIQRQFFLDEWEVYEREKIVLLSDTDSCQVDVPSVVDEGSASVVHWWNGTDRGETEILGEKPVPLPPWPPPIPQWLAWDRIRSLALRGRRLAAWASLWCHGWTISTWRFASLGCKTGNGAVFNVLGYSLEGLQLSWRKWMRCNGKFADFTRYNCVYL